MKCAFALANKTLTILLFTGFALVCVGGVDNMKTFACFRVCLWGENIRIDMEDEESGEGRKFAGVHVN